MSVRLVPPGARPKVGSPRAEIPRDSTNNHRHRTIFQQLLAAFGRNRAESVLSASARWAERQHNDYSTLLNRRFGVNLVPPTGAHFGNPRAEFHRNSPNICRHHTKFQQLPAVVFPNSGRVRPQRWNLVSPQSTSDHSGCGLGRSWPKPAHIGPNRPDSARFRPTLADIGLESANEGQTPRVLGQLPTDAGQHLTKYNAINTFPGSMPFGPISADVGRDWMEWRPRARPTWGHHSIDSGPASADTCAKWYLVLPDVSRHRSTVVQWPSVPHFTDSRPNSADIGRDRAESGRVGPRAAKLRPSLVRTRFDASRMDSARVRPNSAGSCSNFVRCRTTLGEVRGNLPRGSEFGPPGRRSEIEPGTAIEQHGAVVVLPFHPPRGRRRCSWVLFRVMFRVAVLCRRSGGKRTIAGHMPLGNGTGVDGALAAREDVCLCDENLVSASLWANSPR